MGQGEAEQPTSADVMAAALAASMALDMLARAAERFHGEIESSAVILDGLRRLLEASQ